MLPARNFLSSLLVTALLALPAVAQNLATRPTAQSQRFSSAMSIGDRQFLRQAAMDNLETLQIARLALQKSTTTKIRQVAQEVLTLGERQELSLQQLGYEKGVELPHHLSIGNIASYDQLAQKNGTQFEQGLLRQLAVLEQKEDALLQQQSQFGSDPDLRLYASGSLSKVKHEHQMISAFLH